MNELIGIFDDVLNIMVSYPVTLFYLFFSPEKVVGAVKSSFISPPGASLIISLVIWYFAVSTSNSILNPSVDWPRSPTKTLVIRMIVLIIFILLFQYLVISIPSLLPIPPPDPKATVGFLSYPVSAYLVVNGIAYLLFILFPFRSKLTIYEMIDPIVRDVRKGKARFVPEENATTISSYLSALAFFICLYNVTRAVFQISFYRAIFLSSILTVISFLLLVGWIVVAGRYDRNVKDIASDKTIMPDQRIDENKTAHNKPEIPK